MTVRAREAVAAEFLRKALVDDALAVPKLELMARAAGLLGERQRITNAKLFRRAKNSLGIRSIRDGFGAGGGWLWGLPRDPGGASATSPITPRARTEPRVPADWVEGVARLQYQPPPSDVPPHRWRQLMDDCNTFLNSPEKWAERAARLGWNAKALFGCRRNHPLLHLGRAGLLWAVNGGRLVDLNRDWAVIDRPVNGSQRIFYRRDLDAAEVTLPWSLRAGGE
jgi:hypothetical protein